MARKMKEPTNTSLVMAALRESGDMMTIEQLIAATGASRNQLSAACGHLRRHSAVDRVVNNDGKQWWYALPPANDNRAKTIDQRAPETKPRAKRRYRHKAI